MNFNELKELISLIDKSDLSGFQYSKDGLKLKIEKGSYSSAEKTNVQYENKPTALCNPQPVMAIEPQTATQEAPKEVSIQSGTVVKSPLVGVYYASPSPTSAPFIQVGQQVKKGEVLCIVEAMKVMNEINAEQDGTILELFAANESLVEYGQPLVRIG